MTTSLFPAAVSLTGLFAVSAIVLLAGLILRNPLAPKWLQGEAAAIGVGLLMTTAAICALLVAAAGLAGANVHYGIVIVILAGVQAGSAWILWKMFKVGDRLARADAGQSPFARRPKAPVAPVAALAAAPAI